MENNPTSVTRHLRRYGVLRSFNDNRSMKMAAALELLKYLLIKIVLISTEFTIAGPRFVLGRFDARQQQIGTCT